MISFGETVLVVYKPDESQGSYLLFEVSPVLFINENKVQVIPDTEFLVYFPESWGKVKSTKE